MYFLKLHKNLKDPILPLKKKKRKKSEWRASDRCEVKVWSIDIIRNKIKTLE